MADNNKDNTPAASTKSPKIEVPVDTIIQKFVKAAGPPLKKAVDQLLEFKDVADGHLDMVLRFGGYQRVMDAANDFGSGISKSDDLSFEYTLEEHKKTKLSKAVVGDKCKGKSDDFIVKGNDGKKIEVTVEDKKKGLVIDDGKLGKIEEEKFPVTVKIVAAWELNEQLIKDGFAKYKSNKFARMCTEVFLTFAGIHLVLKGGFAETAIITHALVSSCASTMKPMIAFSTEDEEIDAWGYIVLNTALYVVFGLLSLIGFGFHLAVALIGAKLVTLSYCRHKLGEGSIAKAAEVPEEKYREKAQEQTSLMMLGGLFIAGLLLQFLDLGNWSFVRPLLFLGPKPLNWMAGGLR